MRKLLSAALCAFLFSCSAYQYVPVLDGEKHDCVDRAVLLVQKLRAEGKEAYVVLGLIKEGGEVKAAHAWVKYRRPDGSWAVIKNY